MSDSVSFEGVSPGDLLRQGNFFRVVWIVNAAGAVMPAFAVKHVLTEAFDNIPKSTSGAVIAVSEFTTQLGDNALVVDVAVRPAGVGVQVGKLAQWLNDTDFAVSLYRLIKIDAETARDPVSRDAALQLANSDQKSLHPSISDELGKFGSVVKWLIIGIVVVAIAAAVWKLKR